ncbi:MAG: tRNA (adenosine(37)-N6)-threonylcarbamoyltransferase complex dimerization subunit type 1 TsaB [Candidatus Dormiibacterota bacterium]
MTVLAIDTSSRSRVVCVLATPGGELLDSELIRGRPVSSSLPDALGELLPRVDGAVVVVTGPGTYTGVRAGMAAALGIAHARALPLHGVGSLEVTACGDAGVRGDDWVIADAGRGALYVARAGAAADVTRIGVDGFDADGVRVFSSDDVAVPGLIRVDGARALARAVVLALARPALERAGLSAGYVD